MYFERLYGNLPDYKAFTKYHNLVRWSETKNSKILIHGNFLFSYLMTTEHFEIRVTSNSDVIRHNCIISLGQCRILD